MTAIFSMNLFNIKEIKWIFNHFAITYNITYGQMHFNVHHPQFSKIEDNIKSAELLIDLSYQKKDIEFIKHLVTNGCKIKPKSIKQIALDGNHELLKWIIENQKNTKIIKYAVNVHLCKNKELLDWFIEKLT